MPPKRKAATVKQVQRVAEEDLGSGDPPTKLRKRKLGNENKEKIEMKQSVPSKGSTKEKKRADSDAKDMPEKRKPSTRGKKNLEGKVEKDEGRNNKPDSKSTKGKTKDNTNVTKRKDTVKKKAVEPVKRKEKDNEEEEEKSGPSNSTVTKSKWHKIDFTCNKKNGEGQKFNMKISSWNIGGLKSWIKKDCLKFLEHENSDILCFQETKCSEEKLPKEIKELQSYKQYWCSSSKEGYAGVGLLTKETPLKVTYGINNSEQDEDARCITAEFKEFYVICVYVPNAGRKLVNLPKRLEWNTIFKDYIKILDNEKPVIVCGDMNVSHSEIDLARPASNTKNAGFTKEERDGMTDFLQDGYIDTFRKMYPDKTDMYTFWTYMANARAKNIGWRLDYFIVSERIMDKVCDIAHRSEVLGSDHCPITLFINI